MSRLREILDGVFRRGTRYYRGFGVSLGGFKMSCLPFAETVFFNAVGLLTDLTNDVTWRFGEKADISLASAFKKFYNTYAKVVLTNYFVEGYVVIAHEVIGEGAARVDSFRMARKEDYVKHTEKEYVTFTPTDHAKANGIELYVIASSTIETTGKSHRQLAQPYLTYLDNALNASNTITQRLGAMVVASPAGTQNTFGRLNEQEKHEIEEEIKKEYGALAQQSQFLLLPKEMNMQVVSLASLDLKTDSRVRTAVLAIADLVKVPANQIGMIDANSSKALSNGSELIAGDLAKYKSFERLLDETFGRMVRDLGLPPVGYENIDGVETPIYYGIYNKPKVNSNEGSANA